MHVGIVCRISVGMMFATIAVLVAGIVELFRLRAVWKFPNEECCSYTINQTIGIINPKLGSHDYSHLPHESVTCILLIFHVQLHVKFIC